MSPQLPLDVLINILTLLPAQRDRREINVSIFVSCLRVNSLWHEAVSQSSLWKEHYQIRYEHCDGEQEQRRAQSLRNDWRLMYAQRRRIDNMAQDHLDRIVASRIDRQSVATSLAGYAMDIFDVLELECTCPIPQPFASDVDVEGFEGQKMPDHALSRRYWAKSMLDTISRGHGVSIWKRFWTASTPEENPSFEETMSSLSTFFGVSEKRIKRRLDDLASKCRENLQGKCISLDYKDSNYDLPALCKEICIFMRGQGFTRVVQHSEHAYMEGDSVILNKFPHAYLMTKRATLPISLVHVFVAIATRFGIQAAPVNFPGVVLTHILPRGPDPKTFIVNPSASDPTYAVIDNNTPLNQNPPLQMQIILQQLASSEHLQPCRSELMLMRACANISATFMTLREYNRPEVRPSTLLPLCANLLFQADDRTLDDLLSNANLRPMDCIFLIKDLAPILKAQCENRLRDACRTVLHDEAIAESRIRNRKPGGPKYFVGMAFQHARSGYRGFIWSWDDVCKATEPWMQHLHVDALSRGRNQPFYNIYSVDGSQRYVAEENVVPTYFTKAHVQSLAQKFEDFPVIFEDVQLAEQPDKGINFPEGRGRLLLSPHTKYTYPDDSDVGAYWAASGLFERPN